MVTGVFFTPRPALHIRTLKNECVTSTKTNKQKSCIWLYAKHDFCSKKHCLNSHTQKFPFKVKPSKPVPQMLWHNIILKYDKQGVHCRSFLISSSPSEDTCKILCIPILLISLKITKENITLQFMKVLKYDYIFRFYFEMTKRLCFNGYNLNRRVAPEDLRSDWCNQRRYCVRKQVSLCGHPAGR